MYRHLCVWYIMVETSLSLEFEMYTDAKDQAVVV